MYGGTRFWAGGLVLLMTSLPVSLAQSAKEDPLKVGSVWSGKLTQKGQIDNKEVTLNLDATLTIIQRKGEKFDAELYEKGASGSGLELTYLVTGELTPSADGKGYEIQFRSFGYKNPKSATFLKIPYVGSLKANTLKGTWKHPKNAQGITIEGDFNLERKPN